jgi:hypothetical protein
MTVAELGRRMSSAEFSEWQRYAALEPFGPLRDDERAGVVASVLANVYRPRGRDPFGPADFFIELAPPKAEPTVEELRAKLLAWGAADRQKRRGRKVRR